jgi:hypothetical protein
VFGGWWWGLQGEREGVADGRSKQAFIFRSFDWGRTVVGLAEPAEGDQPVHAPFPGLGVCVCARARVCVCVCEGLRCV